MMISDERLVNCRILVPSEDLLFNWSVTPFAALAHAFALRAEDSRNC